MRKLVILLYLLTTSAFGFDNGQYQNVDPKIRKWFKELRSPSNIPCCDIADGHMTTWRPSQVNGYEYEAYIEEQWVPVPPEVVIRGIPNPTGSAVVWYIKLSEIIQIRCFILGDAS